MLKLHLISELKEAFINLKDKKVEAPRPIKPPFPLPPLYKKMVLYEKKCIGCGACALNCPAQCIGVSDNKKYRVVEFQLTSCIYCGLCAEVCPVTAISFVPGNELPSPSKEHLHHELWIKLKRCEHCREIIGTTKVILKTVKDLFAPLTTRELEWVGLCSTCRRKLQSDVLIRQFTK